MLICTCNLLFSVFCELKNVPFSFDFQVRDIRILLHCKLLLCKFRKLEGFSFKMSMVLIMIVIGRNFYTKASTKHQTNV